MSRGTSEFAREERGFSLSSISARHAYLCSVRRLSEVHAMEPAGDSLICGHIKHAANGMLFVATLEQLLLPVVSEVLTADW